MASSGQQKGLQKLWIFGYFYLNGFRSKNGDSETTILAQFDFLKSWFHKIFNSCWNITIEKKNAAKIMISKVDFPEIQNICRKNHDF